MIRVTDTELLAWLSAFLLPTFRILAMMSSGPLLSNRAFPVRARVAAAIAIALAAAPQAPVSPGIDIGSADAFAIVAREVAIGLAIGFVARLVFAAFEIGGELIGLQMGLSYAGFFDPSSGQANAVGRLLSTFSLLTFIALNGPLILISAIVQSFTAFPIGVPQALPLARLMPTEVFADMFRLGLALALPFIGLLLFMNLVLGVISRVAPQFNVFAVGFPATIGAGLTLFATGLPLVEQPLADATTRLLALLGQ
jgi:flagellar biosynthetic protein FliR